MDELLKAIEELKRAYKSSGTKSVKVELDKDTMIQIDGVQKQLPITNGEWLRGLSDEELSNKMCELSVIICGEVEEGETGCPLTLAMSEKERIDRCYRCRLAWLRDEHKEQ